MKRIKWNLSKIKGKTVVASLLSNYKEKNHPQLKQFQSTKNRKEIRVFKSRQLPTSTIHFNSKLGKDDGGEVQKVGKFLSQKGLLMRSFTSGEGKHDTSNVIWMSILMVTLITMLFWGKFCAILCTSSCLYFLPIMKSTHHGT